MENKHEIGALILRVVLGFLFFYHGLVKFQGGIENTVGWFDSIGIPGFMAYVVALVELLGGIALIIGFATKIVSVLFVVLMIGAIVSVKFAVGLLGNGQMAGYELDLAFMAMAAALAFTGSNLYSVDSLFNKKD
ncbi:DoxX family protein [Neobacillus sp. SCS-31]|uniref:DoxX family protein n=1 Tax=Neobacillus oceani TaxID=3115292 RepID=UPI003905ADC4